MNPATITPGLVGEITHIAAGGGYNFGDGKVSVGYAKKTTASFAAGGPEATDSNMWLGGSFNMTTKVALTAAYYSNTKNAGGGAVDSTKKIMMAGVTYDLSKKTQVYFELDKTTANAGGAAKDVITSGTSLGLSTSF
jgi:predicted porin